MVTARKIKSIHVLHAIGFLIIIQHFFFSWTSANMVPKENKIYGCCYTHKKHRSYIVFYHIKTASSRSTMVETQLSCNIRFYKIIRLFVYFSCATDTTWSFSFIYTDWWSFLVIFSYFDLSRPSEGIIGWHNRVPS